MRLGIGVAILTIILMVVGVAFGGRVITVDDDGPADFATIQVAINDADYGDVVSVAAGTYVENVTMKEGVNLEGAGARVTIIAPTSWAQAVVVGASDCKISGFSIVGDAHEDIDGIHCVGVQGFEISNNIIRDNSWSGIDADASSMVISNNLITGSIVAGIFIRSGSDEPSLIINNTLWANRNKADITLWQGASAKIVNNIMEDISFPDSTAILVHNNILAMNAGGGNISTDPLFIDPNNGDYHLKSQAGRWDAAGQSWVQDEVTSSCIDAGDPMSPIGPEAFPNGGIVNMGAYGGTIEASKSWFGKPVCETIVAGDINGDCVVDFMDFAIMAFHWLEDNSPVKRGIQVTDVKIIRYETVGGHFQVDQEVNEVTVGDAFVIKVEVKNFGSETKFLSNLYGWELSPEGAVELVGDDSAGCAAFFGLEPGQSTTLIPFCISHAFEAEQAGTVTLDISVGGGLCEHEFSFEVLPAQQGVEVTAVKIFRYESPSQNPVEVNEVTVGDTFVIKIEVTNFTSQTKFMSNLYSWQLAPEGAVELIGGGSSCAAFFGLGPGQSTTLIPFCASHSLEAMQAGIVTFDITVGDLCEYHFSFEVKNE